MMKSAKLSIMSLLLLAALTLNLMACTAPIQAADLTKGITPNPVEGKDSDSDFISSTANFSLELFRKTAARQENSIISPLSVLLALAMTANGADNETLVQMEAVLGTDSIAELNAYLHAYVNSLPNTSKAKLTIANSIWFRGDDDSIEVEKDFLQKNADYYCADIFNSAFDGQTVKDINNWVKKNTDGMIDKILEEISPEAVMFLLNAIAFDAKWQNPYEEGDIHPGEFTAYDGKIQQAVMMRSTESLYLDDGCATGFIKPYARGDYSLVALLPNPGVSVEEYIDTLSGERFLHMLAEAQETSVTATMPAFSYEYTVTMNEALIAMGMPQAFAEDADFSKLGRSSLGNIYIGEVLHKAFISVDGQGTKAAAVTGVILGATSCLQAKEVTLDRPFVFAIIDNASNLPIFIGTVLEINQ